MTIYRELRAVGASADVAPRGGEQSSMVANSDRLLNSVLTIAYFDRLGVPRLS